MVDLLKSGSTLLFGLFLGSFAGATVWRLRARQLRGDDKRLVELRTKKQLTDEDRLEKSLLSSESAQRKKERHQLDKLIAPLAHDRSRCLGCGHALAWYDLVPLVSWFSTGGKCRYCHKKIGWLEPSIELGTALLFGLTSYWWVAAQAGQPLAVLVLWLVIVVGLVILFVYDLKWFLLPDNIVLPLIGLAALVAGQYVITTPDKLAAVVELAFSLVIMSGLYAAVYYYSRWRYGEANTWIGFGDVKLGLVLGLLLGRWELAFLALFLANVIGLIAIAPALIRGKAGLKTHIPFGPLLILGFFGALFWGHVIIDWYMKLTLLAV